MELSIIFLFVVFSILLIYLAHLFSSRLFLLGASITLLFLSLDVLNNGYQLSETVSSVGSFNYTYNSTISSNVLSSMRITNSEVYRSVYDTFSQTFGFLMLLSSIIVGLIGASKMK